MTMLFTVSYVLLAPLQAICAVIALYVISSNYDASDDDDDGQEKYEQRIPF